MINVSIVIPIYNEEKNILLLVQNISTILNTTKYAYQLILVDDGSNDGTLTTLQNLAYQNNTIKYISFSRNFGHQIALKAGLDAATGDCVISMDGDMQHPPELLLPMLEKYEQGYDVVYTIRKQHEDIGYIKQKTSSMYYTLLNKLSEVQVENGAADFRLLTQQVLHIIRNMPEQDLFFRGIIKWIGFKQIAIEYNPKLRANGSTKYTYKKMFTLALNGILSFSKKPLYLAAYLGIGFSALSLLYIPYITISLIYGVTISGWASVIATITFFGGLQLLLLGVIGLYIGRLFMQSKQRPLYIIKESNLA